MSRTELEGRVVLVTGASSGIGAALAREVVARGGAAVLLGRRASRLQELSRELGERTLAHTGDVTNDGAVEGAIAAGAERFGGVDVLIANAGFGVEGEVSALSLDDYRRQFETNVFGVIRSVQEALPELERRKGAIGIVGSVNGYVSIPGWSAYCMSKHAVRSFAEALRLELSPRGVSVTHLAPGFVESEFRRVDNHAELRSDGQDFVPSWLVMGAAPAASKMLDAVLHGRPEAVITVHGKLAVGFARHTPELVSEALRLGGGIARRFSKRG
jgi:short-subunit dehydrogenase